ncbi:NmrA family NAD(P)-binding protein [Chitinophaga filiformis]|uniref:NmrA family NAD(P)-binding protein n=1 Tax=Chitinophaga filiformis TaxID=104663 RepID=UPI001F3B70AB|nr:NmrA family NAD(P)-binding protein [Chitinophaga filiformis]MCF6403656.1 NmrA family NAD(P)-binding protein [Chitinophaga filiformis]
MKILVAGATGNLGSRIIRELLTRGTDIRVLIRPNTALKKIAALKHHDIGIIQTDMTNIHEMTLACKGVDCVISALQGLHDVIVDVQTILLAAAVNAGVPRFIPSDFAADFTKQPRGENRNFDLRREFHERLDRAPIAATSILTGAFAELLCNHTPLLDLQNNTVGYWEDPDWRLDFTTMDNAAAYTAAVALDTAAPRILRIAGFQVSPKELAATAGTVKEREFKLVKMGSLAELAAYNQQERAAHPEGENELYPHWQQSQYIQSMFSVQLAPLDNHRYPDIAWTDAAAFISKM